MNNQEPNAQQFQSTQQSTQPSQPKGTSGLAIAGLVLGIVSILTSFLPILNNGSFFIAIIGLILGIIGFTQTRKKKNGSGIAVAAIILNILSCVIVLVSQSMYSAALNAAVDNVSNPSTSIVSSNPSSTAPSTTSSTAQETRDLPLGTTVEVNDGLQVTVNSITSGLQNYDGSAVTQVNVTYLNQSSSTESFNVFDWKSENAQGVQSSYTYYSSAENELSSGSLASGGTITGNLYFKGDVSKVLYFNNMFFQDSYISWVA